MKKILTLLPFICGVALYIVLSGNSAGVGTVSRIERTGVTDISGCQGCHGSPSGGSISDTIQLMQGGLPVTNYVPGQAYTVHISAANTSTSSSLRLRRFGFQLTAVQSGTYVNAGTLTAPAGTHTIAPVSGVLVVEQSSPLMRLIGSGTGGIGTRYIVDIPWTAPAAGTGSVTFRNALNCVNSTSLYDSSANGDVFNTASIVVTELTTGTPSQYAAPGQLSIYPNPANRVFTLNLVSLVDERIHIIITNISGERVKELELNTNEPTAISLNQAPGIYFISVATLLHSYFQQIQIR